MLYLKLRVKKILLQITVRGIHILHTLGDISFSTSLFTEVNGENLQPPEIVGVISFLLLKKKKFNLLGDPTKAVRSFVGADDGFGGTGGESYIASKSGSY